jgi:hypothetical protein
MPSPAKTMRLLLESIPANWPAKIKSVFENSASFQSVTTPPHPSTALGDSAGALAREASSYEKHALKRQLLEAFLLYALDDIHAAHSIFQEDDSFFGSYGHGMMHRREGDFWNANYWFRRAGNPRHLCFPDNRSPSEITAICEKAMGNPRMLPETIHLLHQEWVLLLGTLLTTPSADL